MKNMIIILTLMTSLNTMAGMPWNHLGVDVCTDISNSGLTVVEKLFCTTEGTYDFFSFCKEVQCLTDYHLTHCEEVLAETVRSEDISLQQGDEATQELSAAFRRYCF